MSLGQREKGLFLLCRVVVLAGDHGDDTREMPEETVPREGIIWRDSFLEVGLYLCQLGVM